MKKLVFILIIAILGLTACKNSKKQENPEPKPSEITEQAIEQGYVKPEPNILKASKSIWSENGIRITWDSSLGNGISPNETITLVNYETMQLAYEFLEPQTEGGIIAWYTNDQQIASVNWIGLLEASWIGTWFPNYPTTTVIYLYYYRPNPKYNGKNKKWLDPYIDNIIVNVTQ